MAGFLSSMLNGVTFCCWLFLFLRSIASDTNIAIVASILCVREKPDVLPPSPWSIDLIAEKQQNWSYHYPQIARHLKENKLNFLVSIWYSNTSIVTEALQWIKFTEKFYCSQRDCSDLKHSTSLEVQFLNLFCTTDLIKFLNSAKINKVNFVSSFV